MTLTITQNYQNHSNNILGHCSLHCGLQGVIKCPFPIPGADVLWQQGVTPFSFLPEDTREKKSKHLSHLPSSIPYPLHPNWRPTRTCIPLDHVNSMESEIKKINPGWTLIPASSSCMPGIAEVTGNWIHMGDLDWVLGFCLWLWPLKAFGGMNQQMHALSLSCSRSCSFCPCLASKAKQYLNIEKKMRIYCLLY